MFCGGRAVLPLLQSTVVPTGAVSSADFLAGHGASQAVPGPLLGFSAYLGAGMNPSVVGVLPFRDLLRRRIGANPVGGAGVCNRRLTVGDRLSRMGATPSPA